MLDSLLDDREIAESLPVITSEESKHRLSRKEPSARINPVVNGQKNGQKNELPRWKNEKLRIHLIHV
jgi:hypothetical protein